MPKISYVYPNLSPSHLGSITQRGGLLERWHLAQETGCEYIHVPATLIKNKTEERMTSLNIGDFLSKKEISLLYTQDSDIPKDLKYVLHTEPALSKTNRFGRKIQPDIKWYDKDWCSKYLEMIKSITKYLNHPASVIEIHPGFRKNSFEHVALFIENLLKSYYDAFKEKPLILLENRTEQFISKGKDIRDYWDYLIRNFPSLEEYTGIVLDVQQLFTKTGGKFLEEYTVITNDCLKAFHIHTLHRWPKLSDRIPWKLVFGKIKQIRGNVLINPEIHQKNRVKQVIQYCTRLLE